MRAFRLHIVSAARGGLPQPRVLLLPLVLTCLLASGAGCESGGGSSSEAKDVPDAQAGDDATAEITPDGTSGDGVAGDVALPDGLALDTAADTAAEIAADTAAEIAADATPDIHDAVPDSAGDAAADAQDGAGGDAASDVAFTDADVDEVGLSFVSVNAAVMTTPPPSTSTGQVNFTLRIENGSAAAITGFELLGGRVELTSGVVSFGIMADDFWLYGFDGAVEAGATVDVDGFVSASGGYEGHCDMQVIVSFDVTWDGAPTVTVAAEPVTLGCSF